MKIEKMINVVLSEEDMKKAVMSYVLRNVLWVADHMKNNYWTIDTNDKGEFVICIDGVCEEMEL